LIPIELKELCLEILKFFIPFAAAFFGANLAYRNMLKKQRYDEELKKLGNANKLFLQASECLDTLMTIRSLYSSLAHFSGRGLQIPPFPIIFPQANVDIANLTFMSKSVEPKPDPLDIDLLAVSGIFVNYDLALERWKIRTACVLNLTSEISGEKTFEPVMFDGDTSFSEDKVFEKFSRLKILDVLKSTESAIQATESTIQDLSKIVNNWPASVMLRIDKKIPKKDQLILYRKSKFSPPIQLETFSANELIKFLSLKKN
jgi:hypothetical protein